MSEYAQVTRLGLGQSPRRGRDGRETGMTSITLTNAHGTFTCTPGELDLAVMRHLPASVNGLWTAMEEINPKADYSDVRTVSEFLVMLADAKEF